MQESDFRKALREAKEKYKGFLEEQRTTSGVVMGDLTRFAAKAAEECGLSHSFEKGFDSNPITRAIIIMAEPKEYGMGEGEIAAMNQYIEEAWQYYQAVQ